MATADSPAAARAAENNDELQELLSELSNCHLRWACDTDIQKGTFVHVSHCCTFESLCSVSIK